MTREDARPQYSQNKKSKFDVSLSHLCVRSIIAFEVSVILIYVIYSVAWTASRSLVALRCSPLPGAMASGRCLPVRSWSSGRSVSGHHSLCTVSVVYVHLPRTVLQSMSLHHQKWRNIETIQKIKCSCILSYYFNLGLKFTLSNQTLFPTDFFPKTSIQKRQNGHGT